MRCSRRGNEADLRQRLPPPHVGGYGWFGGRDMEAGAVSVRLHHGGPQGAKPKGEVLTGILASIKDAKITKDVRKYAAEQGITEEEALKKGMEEKSKEFTNRGSEIYAKA